MQLNDQGQIIFARDIVEPAIKPGAASLGGISVVAPLVRFGAPTCFCLAHRCAASGSIPPAGQVDHDVLADPCMAAGGGTQSCACYV